MGLYVTDYQNIAVPGPESADPGNPRAKFDHLIETACIELRSKDARVPLDESNTCYRMVERVMTALQAKGRVLLEIEKRLPVQGGLGGASGNAVAALLGRNAPLKSPGTLGSVGRNSLTGPRFATADVALLKNVALRGSSSLQFRAEVFNLTNHVNFGQPSANVFAQTVNGGGSLSPTAGRITTTASTSRQIQFALKLLF